MDFSQWLQDEMEKNKLTEYRLAKLSGVHQSTIKNLLNGAKPQIKTEGKIKIAIEQISKNKQKEIPPTEKVDGMEEELIRTLCKTGYTHCGSRTNKVSCEILCEICSQVLPNHLANRYSMIAICRLVGLSSNIISPLEFPAIMPTS